MPRITKKAILAAEVINGGVLVVKKYEGIRVEREFRHDEVAGIKAHCEGLNATGEYEVIFVRWWTQNDLLPVGQRFGVRGESFKVVAKVKAVRKSRKLVAAA